MDVDLLGWEVLEGIGGGLGVGPESLSKTIFSNFIYEYDLLRSYPQLHSSQTRPPHASPNFMSSFSFL